MSEPPVETTADHVHAHPRRSGRPWFDVILAVTAIFISMVSLYVAIEHGRTERDLVAASNWPFLQVLLNDHFQGEDQFAIGATNAGTGPAKVHSFEMALDGRWISSPEELLQRCCGAPTDPAASRVFPAGTLSMSAIDNTVLRPAESNPVLIFNRRPDNAEMAGRLHAAVGRMTFRVCYCSALDQCWQGDLRHLDAKSVKTCEAPEHPYQSISRRRDL